MNIYALKFREKGEKQYVSVLFQAKDENELGVKFRLWAEEEQRSGGFDIDKRTLSWAGGSIPLGRADQPLVIYENLDNMT